MKRVLLFFVVILMSANLNNISARNIDYAVKGDSLNIMAEFSLFYEYFKNKDYKSALPHGWNVLSTNPQPFLKYKLFDKMETMLWFQHDSVATDPAEKLQIADTTIYLYDMAESLLPADETARFYQKEGYILENWYDEPNTEKAIANYEKAIEVNPDTDSFYKDRLGLLYQRMADFDPEYKMKALDLYSKLSEEDPTNQVWVSRIEGLAENVDELIDITKKAWDLDKENTEKAWKYASLTFKNAEYEKSIEPLQFLIEKSPNVTNYYDKLARAYTKLGNSAKAIQAYKKLLELDPQNKDYYVNIAIIYKDLSQPSVARSYLQKAMKVDPEWDYPYYILGTMYEQAARECGFEFMDRVVYLLATDEYRVAAKKGGQYSGASADRVSALKDSVPQKEDYFFRKLKPGDKIKIEGKCYGWIDKTVVVPE